MIFDPDARDDPLPPFSGRVSRFGDPLGVHHRDPSVTPSGTAWRWIGAFVVLFVISLLWVTFFALAAMAALPHWRSP